MHDSDIRGNDGGNADKQWALVYTGALAIRNIFDLQSLPLWSISAIIGTFGACYALFGGLKAVAVSDCLNGIGLLIVGIWVPAAALYELGGVHSLFEEPEVLKPLVTHSVIAPWHVKLGQLSSRQVPNSMVRFFLVRQWE
eukprot:Skav230341  [mRNA]  locus=scaffold920:385438:388711:- [translate_table: standard]